jgi:cysteine desulfuration protein SufE
MDLAMQPCEPEPQPGPDLPPRLARLVEAFCRMPDRQERIQELIGIARRFRPVPATIAERPFPEDHKVPACESEAYLWAEPQPDGTLKFHFAVDNPQGISAQAMAVILDETLSGAPLAQVAQVPLDLPYRLFGRELSMGKSMGLMGMVGMAQAAARRQLAGQAGAQPS